MFIKQSNGWGTSHWSYIFCINKWYALLSTLRIWIAQNKHTQCRDCMINIWCGLLCCFFFNTKHWNYHLQSKKKKKNSKQQNRNSNEKFKQIIIYARVYMGYDIRCLLLELNWLKALTDNWSYRIKNSNQTPTQTDFFCYFKFGTHKTKNTI